MSPPLFPAQPRLFPSSTRASLRGHARSVPLRFNPPGWLTPSPAGTPLPQPLFLPPLFQLSTGALERSLIHLVPPSLRVSFHRSASPPQPLTIPFQAARVRL